MTNTATLNTSNKNTNNCGKLKYILRTKQKLLHTKSANTTTEFSGERERVTKSFYTNKGKRQKSEYLSIYTVKKYKIKTLARLEEREKERQRQTDSRQTDRQTLRDRERHIETDRQRQTDRGTDRDRDRDRQRQTDT